MTTRPISEDDLQAHIDHALDAQRMAAVTAYLDEHPEAAARIAAYERQRTLLREALRPVAEEPIPPELNLGHLIEQRTQLSRRRLSRWQSAAAALLLALGGASGWLAHASLQPPRAGIASLAQEAADSYAVFAPDLGHPVEIKAEERSQLVNWASRRLDRAVAVPDLSASGFVFIGGRLVATPHGPAVFYMFDNGRGTRLVMLMRNMAIDKNSPMAEHDNGPIGTVSWSRDGLGYSLVGPLASASLHPIADAARLQIERNS